MDRSRSTVPKPEHGPDLSPSPEPPEVGAVMQRQMLSSVWSPTQCVSLSRARWATTAVYLAQPSRRPSPLS